ncbi:hypothetical protein LMG28688_02578 [Paraburkholderia caffeinitolerans]|uniref:Uncharacterized protein n=1 Tax=Paraburkholderia caffeinitolerans TaxID=1723730 RepID=A0A6J5FVG3_9BURK|nr:MULTISPECIES: hypothetical protein [Paraburkholderia]CAB3787906.1 hypothetical protein LMG28688_02578 [Paraburkholderia caffeinitolerans]
MWEITHIFLTSGGARTNVAALSHMHIVSISGVSPIASTTILSLPNGIGISVEH